VWRDDLRDNNAPGDYYELRDHPVKKTPFGSDLKEQGTRLDYCLACAPKQWKKVQDALDK